MNCNFLKKLEGVLILQAGELGVQCIAVAGQTDGKGRKRNMAITLELYLGNM